MTEQKTTTTRKRTTRTKTQPVETTNVEVAKVEIQNVVEEKRAITEDTKIAVMNNTTGMYGYKSSTYVLDLFEYGDVGYIPFGELRKMNSFEKRHIHDAFIVILDEDAVEELNLQPLYRNILDKDGVSEILNDATRLESMYSQMPQSMKETVITIARRRFNSTNPSEQLTDLRVAQVIKKLSGIDILE